jgi:hypothetical protein
MSVLQRNRKVFDDTIGRAEGALGQAERLVPAAAVAIALLAFLGLRGRIREYAG